MGVASNAPISRLDDKYNIDYNNKSSSIHQLSPITVDQYTPNTNQCHCCLKAIFSFFYRESSGISLEYYASNVQ